jgi:addiction module RelE/StbE family toxin
MVKKRWSEQAYNSLKVIFQSHEENPARAKKIITIILEQVESIQFTEQYQVDEILGIPFRRMMVKDFRVVYKVVDSETIEILQIFDNRQSPSRLRRKFK